MYPSTKPCILNQAHSRSKSRPRKKIQTIQNIILFSRNELSPSPIYQVPSTRQSSTVHTALAPGIDWRITSIWLLLITLPSPIVTQNNGERNKTRCQGDSSYVTHHDTVLLSTDKRTVVPSSRM